MTTPSDGAPAGAPNNDAAAGGVPASTDGAAATGAAPAGGGSDGGQPGAQGGAAGSSSLLVAAGAAATVQGAEGQAGDEPKLPAWSELRKLLVKDPELAKRAERYGSLEDVLKNELNLRKEMSKARDGYVKPPGKDAGEDDVKAWRKTLGVPETAAGYGIAPVETAPPEAAEELGTFLELSHRNNLSTEQVKTLVEFDRMRAEAAERRRQEQLVRSCEEAAQKLQGEWMGDYRRNTELANRAFEYLGGDGVRELMDTEVGGRKLGAHPVLMKMLHKAGELLQSDIPHLAASKQSISSEFDQIRAEEAKMYGTPGWNDPSFQKRRTAAYERAQGVGLL